MRVRRIIDPDRDWETIGAARIENFCQSSAPSFAWINPEGVVYLLSQDPYEDHIDWARAYLEDILDTQETPYDEDVRPDRVLMDMGWLKMTAATLISVNSKFTTPAAWESAVALMSKCPNMDPDKTRVHIQDRGRSLGGFGGILLGNFLEMFGTRKSVGKFYDVTLSRMNETSQKKSLVERRLRHLIRRTLEQ